MISQLKQQAADAFTDHHVKATQWLRNYQEEQTPHSQHNSDGPPPYLPSLVSSGALPPGAAGTAAMFSAVAEDVVRQQYGIPGGRAAREQSLCADVGYFLARSSARTEVPAWAGFNEAVQPIPSHGPDVDVVRVMPLLDQSPSDYKGAWETLRRFAACNERVNPGKDFIVCVDQLIYRLMKEVSAANREKLRNAVILMGDFHIIETMARVIGCHLEGTDLHLIIAEAGILGVKSAESAMSASGRSYNRCDSIPLFCYC